MSTKTKNKKATSAELRPGVFLKAAELLATPGTDSHGWGACAALADAAGFQHDWYKNIFADLFRDGRSPLGYWWPAPCESSAFCNIPIEEKCTLNARVFALLLAYELAKRGELPL